MNSFGYFWNEKLSQRQTGSLCPESSERNLVLSPELFSDQQDKIQHFKFESKDAEILSLVHDPEYIKKVQTAHSVGLRFLDAGETRVTSDIFEQALLSASAGCKALDKIMSNQIQSAFCAIRPPGHHANRYRGMGFCVFNNLAIAARYAQSNFGIRSVLIVDWDVYPGNGTQEIFWEDPTVFTLSFHQKDLFPESGKSDLVGRGDGKGFNRNVPLPANITTEAYLEKFAEVINEVTKDFRPEILLIAAGFDAHSRDPAGKMNLTDEDFEKMTEILLTITEPYTFGKTLSILEGGYNTASLKDSVVALCKAFAKLA